MAVVGVTFATPDFKWSAEVARQSALTVGCIDRFYVFTPDDLSELIGQYPKIFQQGSRGFGFWSWKPEIMLRVMADHMKTGDLLVYLDAGISFVSSVQPVVEGVRGRDGMLFRVGECTRKNYLQKFYTKRDTFDIMGTHHEKYYLAYQLMGGLQVYRKNARTVSFLTGLRKWCVTPCCIDDTCRADNLPGFVDHRHDQSILTMHYLSEQAHVDLVVSRCVSQFGVHDQDPSRLMLPTLIDIHRRRLRSLPTITVITPTIGTAYLERCIASVQAQDMPCVEHLIVIDGPEHREEVLDIVGRFRDRATIRVLELPFNVGKDGWNGHRAYAACSYLIDTDFVGFLDEDNTFAPEHLSSLVRVILERSQPWAFSLRRIISPSGEAICNDECESLGCLEPSVLHVNDWFVDVNCYLMRVPLAVEVSPLWYSKFRDPVKGESDRNIAAHLFAKYGPILGSRRHSVNYMVGNTRRSVRAEFFQKGNLLRRHVFDVRPDVYVFHFTQAATEAMFQCLFSSDRCYAYDEWQPTQLRDLASRVNLMDGYACQSLVPPGAIVLVNLCHPHTVPLEWLSRRKDLRRVCYTLESPNIRHASQWTGAFLDAHFDAILTYWEPLLQRMPTKASFCPHNTHWLDLENELDRSAGLRENKCRGKSICCVLENRPGRRTYEIDGTRLEQLDGLRHELVRDLDIDLYGLGWDPATLGSDARVIRTNHKGADVESSVDIYQRYSYAVIVENCDAQSYVSEKIMDCFSAGCIPLYWGNNSARVGIPDDMYVDLRSFCTSADLAAWLAADAETTQRKQKIYAGRREVLGRVSQPAFTDRFLSIVQSMGTKSEALVT